MKDKLKDAIYGLVVGDALGFPVQFKYRDQYPLVDSMIPDTLTKLPKGTFSDDTSMTLAICESIKKCGKVDIKDIRCNFEKWLNDGKYTQTGFAIDVGSTCGKAIKEKRGLFDEWSQGNGSLMRTIPLAFIENITNEEIRQVSTITHAHQNCVDACVYYVRIAKDLLIGRSLRDSIMLHIPQNSIYQRIRQIEKLSRDEIKSSGYVVDTFESAMWCLITTDNYRDCLMKAVNLGDDTDTVGAVTGGLAGIIYGIQNIPSNWIDSIYMKEIINNCLF